MRALLASTLMLLLAPPAFCAADPFQSQADWLCQAYTNAASLTDAEIGAHFDPAFLAEATPDTLKTYFVKTAQALGACESSELQTLLPNTPGVTLHTYFLTMASHRRLIISFDLKDSGGNAVMTNPFLSTTTAEQGVTGPKENYSVKAVPVPAKDGTLLQTVVFRPNDQRRRPVVVMRTPYFRLDGQFQYGHYYATADYYINAGYDFVLQAIRGTGGSQGEYEFFSPVEIDDGDAAIRWVDAQPFCNGKIAAVGVSYDGLTALAAGVNNPPGLKVIMAGGSPVTANNGPFIRSGLVLATQLDYLRYNFTQNGPPTDEATLESVLMTKALNEPDLRKYDQILTGQSIPDWQILAEHFSTLNDPFWDTRQFFDRIHEINVPTYHIAGTHADGDMTDVLNNFMEISAHDRFPERHHLILGYWDHPGSIPYDDGSNAGAFIRVRYIPLLDYYLKGIDTPYAHEPRVQMPSTKNMASQVLASPTFPPQGLEEHTLRFENSGGGLRLVDDAAPSAATSSDSSSYLYLPETANSISALDPRQNLLFTYSPGVSLPILGFMDFDLFVKLAGANGGHLSQADILVQVGIQSAQGQVTQISACLVGQKVQVSDANADGVIHIRTQGCFVQRELNPGDSIIVQVTSNGYPLLLRNPGNAPGPDYYGSFQDGQITLLHSAKYQSRMRFTTEP